MYDCKTSMGIISRHQNFIIGKYSAAFICDQTYYQTLHTALQYASRLSSFWVIYNLSVHFVHHSVTECGKPNVSF